jgi:peptidoglycan/LPS O-acetylase OafA/YrhL
MSADYKSFRDMRFFGSLDGLRALSIAGVIWFHSWWGTPYYSKLETIPVLRAGSYGVQIFFVISGFLITTLLLREQERYGAISIRDFYIRRALRIWPLYYATLLLYVVVVFLFERGTGRDRIFAHYLPSFLTYTYTWFLSPKWSGGGIFNLSWTLCTEEQFYAFWPLVLRLLRSAWAAAVMVAIIALRVATGYGWFNPVLTPGGLPSRIVLSIAYSICLGVLLAQALHSERGFRWLYSVLGQKWSAPLALSLMASSLYPAHPNWPATLAATVALVGACVVREDNGLAYILKLRPIAYIGILSYGMYLLNSLSIHVVQTFLGKMGLLNPLLVFPLAMGLAAGAAFVSYRYFESRFLSLKTHFARSRRAPSKSAELGIINAKTGVPVHP